LNLCLIGAVPRAAGLGAQIIALAVAYFAAVTAQDVVTNVGTIDDLLSTARILLTIPVTVLDAIFILWVFTSLSRTLTQVQARRAAAKLDLYRWARHPLGEVSCSCPVLFLLLKSPPPVPSFSSKVSSCHVLLLKSPFPVLSSSS
jgi:Lung seven transmembrane receptor